MQYIFTSIAMDAGHTAYKYEDSSEPHQHGFSQIHDNNCIYMIILCFDKAERDLFY